MQVGLVGVKAYFVGDVFGEKSELSDEESKVNVEGVRVVVS